MNSLMSYIQLTKRLTLVAAGIYFAANLIAALLVKLSRNFFTVFYHFLIFTVSLKLA